MSEKELFEELSARLPYGVKVDVLGEPCEVKGAYIDDYGNYRLFTDCDEKGKHNDVPLETCKMYLRPLKAMNDEEKKAVRNIANSTLYRPSIRYGVKLILWKLPKISRFYYEHHLDVNRLIEQGDAYEASEEMYKF